VHVPVKHAFVVVGEHAAFAERAFNARPRMLYYLYLEAFACHKAGYPCKMKAAYGGWSDLRFFLRETAFSQTRPNLETLALRFQS
jgi:hypothetical protein